MTNYFIQSIFLGLLIGLICSFPVQAQNLSEQEKIEYLITHVENLSDAVFIRNGVIHSPKDAAGHMRTKLRRARRHVTTAEDFIRICASQSSITGRKYLIVFADKGSMESETYLRQVLDDLEYVKKEITDLAG